MRILVVLPTFNNAATLPGVVAETRREIASLDQPGNEVALLVVDDGSTDATRAFLDACEAPCLRHERNLGKGAALATAFAWAARQGFDTVVTLDTDGQHFPSDLGEMVRHCRLHPQSLIVGKRNLLPGQHWPRASRIGLAFSNFWVWLETGRNIGDSQSGFRAYPVSLTHVPTRTRPGYEFETEVLVHSVWAGVKTATVPVGVAYPRDRVSHFRPWTDTFRFIALHGRLSLRRLVRRKPRTLPRSESGRRPPQLRGAVLLEALVRILGLRLCRLIALVVTPFYFLSGWHHARASIRFHARVAPAPLPKLLWRGLISHWHFAFSLVDRMAAGIGLHTPRIEVDAPDDFEERKDGFILVGAHLGDWTLAGFILSKAKSRHVSVVIDRSVSPDFQNRLRGWHESGISFIDASRPPLEVVLDVKKALDAKGIVCFLGDRVTPPMRSLEVEFLGEPAPFPPGPWEVAARLGVAAYTFFCLRDTLLGDAPLALRVRKVCEKRTSEALSHTGDSLLRDFVRELERTATRCPQEWFNFFDFWQRTPASDALLRSGKQGWHPCTSKSITNAP